MNKWGKIYSHCDYSFFAFFHQATEDQSGDSRYLGEGRLKISNLNLLMSDPVPGGNAVFHSQRPLRITLVSSS